MKRLQLILLIFLLSAGIALAKGIGTRIGIVINPGGGSLSVGCGAGYSQLVGADASDIMDSTGGDICVPD